eukprot:gnl/TRDRNA2_/TRDRNA2_87818_c0_seq2.p1 gnl/TRDRNA2_/TRDRNA2_87818_c0~~gnl/TRDRNA2_/TRDRNA2_87818_c0_seq2.p1  ORF type:complete len:280 (+),score=28.00 gnl/TRDRNA2_/TRDRNA2_87818_c0_seq2:56-895(+)
MKTLDLEESQTGRSNAPVPDLRENMLDAALRNYVEVPESRTAALPPPAGFGMAGDGYFPGTESNSFLLPDSSRISFTKVFGTLLPVVYVWSLPLLARIGFASMCPGYPRCQDAHVGASVSRFIANTQATGAMAACFFYPSMHLWINIQYVRHQRGVKHTLAVFQACFGLFLICPVTVVPSLHAAAVCTFCTAALVHYGVVLGHCASSRMYCCMILLSVAIISFSGVFVLVLIAPLDNDGLKRHAPLLFYVFESCGMTTMATFPVLWYRERPSSIRATFS